MAKLKRVSDHQINKDSYDAGEDDRFAEAPDPGQGMARASQHVMQKRKIVKVSRSKSSRGGGAAGAAAAPGATPARPAAPSNPFASTTLAPPAAPPAKANPFASISFASSAGAAAPPPALDFAFGAASSAASAPAPAPAASLGFSFASAAAAPSSTAARPAVVRHPPKGGRATGAHGRIRELNENLLLEVVRHWEGNHHAADYSPFFGEYLEHAEMLEKETDAGSEGTEATTTQASAPAPASTAKPFSLGASAAPPSTGAFSFAAAPAAAPAFSFAAAPAAAPMAGATSAPPLSFGGPPAAAAGGASPAAGDAASNAENGNVEKVEPEENAEEETLHEVRAKLVRSEAGQWKKYGAGILRLYRHRKTGKGRMVIRNQIGKVQFNVGVSRGMTFEKVTKSTKKGEAAYVKFAAVEDASKGLEQCMLQVKPACLEKLHATLEGMVA